MADKSNADGVLVSFTAAWDMLQKAKAVMRQQEAEVVRALGSTPGTYIVGTYILTVITTASGLGVDVKKGVRHGD